MSFVKKARARRWGAAVAIGLSLVLASNAQAQCSSHAECDDGIDCTTDTCVCALACVCQHVSNCTDDIYCNGPETCCTTSGGCGTTPYGQCSQGDPPTCVPGTFCDPIIDSCIQCNDNGDCDDGNDCTDDVCDVNFDCQHTPLAVGDPCDDGDLCTIDDQCDGTAALGACSGTTVVCDLVTCQTGSCNATTGVCDYTYYGDGTNCNPEDRCFPRGECEAGTCVGAPARGCVDIYFETQTTPAAVGDIIAVDLFAQYNATPECTPPPSDCPAGTHPVASVQAVFTWDKDVLELVDPGTGVPNPEDPCNDGASCAGNCVPSCYDCGQTWRQYDWSSSGFPQDCASDKDSINAPCPFHPDNDGDAIYLSFVAIGCDDDNDPGTPLVPAPPACVAGTFPFHVTTLKFLAIGGTAPDTTIAIEDCILQTRSKVLSSSAGDDIRGSVGTPVTVVVQCANDSQCGPGSICANNVCQDCLPPVVEVEGSRYIAVTPPEGPPEVAILVSGTDSNVSCMLGYARQIDSRVDPNLDPSVSPNAAYQAPGPTGWGTAHIRGEGIIGGGTYDVRLDCDRSNPGTSVSDPVTVTMWQGGDADDRFGGGVDILDATLILDAFRGLYLTIRSCSSDADCVGLGKEYCDLAAGKCLWTTLESTDLKGDVMFCRPDRVISIGDVTVSLNFFRGIPDVCDSQCP